MYANGQGVARNDVKAHKWYNIAGANGHKDAIESRNKIEGRMSSQQINEAQKLAESWISSHAK